ncbi:hypothetical protein [Kutzneria kofuensis]|uniref:Uncharacterized protein n=1 Tax=Kutzneria kofuensis TaxID=103725 RepID=A0A7W9NKG2_9PSEU|nr:hypothetical protein [Kutzneria kofuensis]MBB5895644.1 hypothetical protein [Kutzneria kofuensis]
MLTQVAVMPSLTMFSMLIIPLALNHAQPSPARRRYPVSPGILLCRAASSST